MFLLIAVICLTLFYVIYYYLSCVYSYWEKRKIPYVKASLPFGNLKSVMFLEETTFQLYNKIYWEYRNEPLVGLFKFRQPMLLLINPELVQTVMVKEFNNFRDNDMTVKASVDPIFAYNPFTAKGSEWKKVRGLHLPIMTPMKLKGMVSLIRPTCFEMIDYLKLHSDQYFNVFDFTGNFTTDAVATCAYGIAVNSFKEPNNEFSKKFIEIFETFESNMAQLFAFFAPWLNIFRFRIIPKKSHEYFKKLVMSMVMYRRDNKIFRDDLLQRLMEIDDELKKEGTGFSPDEFTAHSFTFLMDGIATSARVLSFILYDLSMHPEVQQKIRNEFKSLNKNFDELILDDLQSLSYTNNVIDESLRLHTVFGNLLKACTSETHLYIPEYGETIKINVGTPVVIPTTSIHGDPKYFNDPTEYYPDRFDDAECKKYFFGFGKGPRNCLGQRFAYIQLKMALTSLMMNFEILPKDPSAKIEVDPKSSFLLEPKMPIFVKFRGL